MLRDREWVKGGGRVQGESGEESVEGEELAEEMRRGEVGWAGTLNNRFLSERRTKSGS